MIASFPRQLTLQLPHAESHARDDFLEGGANRAALALIENWPDWPGRAALLVGPEGAGKSHLASIWADIAGARVAAARTLDVASVPAALATGALVVEDLEPGGFDELALFHLLNLAKQDGSFLFLTARTAPASWALQLPDLASRLRALPTVSLSAPDDALLRAVIVKLAADRQMALDDGVVGYLASRIERSFSAARRAVIRLDEEALRLRRPASRVLAAEIVRELLP